MNQVIFSQGEKSIQLDRQAINSPRIWSVAPPIFIDAIDEDGAEVVGGMLEVYSALQPNILSIDMDSKILDEVEELICAVKNYLKKKVFPKTGSIKSSQIPIDYFDMNGTRFILNTRTSTAL